MSLLAIKAIPRNADAAGHTSTRAGNLSQFPQTPVLLVPQGRFRVKWVILFRVGRLRREASSLPLITSPVPPLHASTAELAPQPSPRPRSNTLWCNSSLRVLQILQSRPAPSKRAGHSASYPFAAVPPQWSIHDPEPLA